MATTIIFFVHCFSESVHDGVRVAADAGRTGWPLNECSRFDDILTTCFWLCKLTATQSKTYLGGVSEAPVEAYK